MTCSIIVLAKITHFRALNYAALNRNKFRKTIENQMNPKTLKHFKLINKKVSHLIQHTESCTQTFLHFKANWAGNSTYWMRFWFLEVPENFCVQTRFAFTKMQMFLIVDLSNKTQNTPQCSSGWHNKGQECLSCHKLWDFCYEANAYWVAAGNKTLMLYMRLCENPSGVAYFLCLAINQKHWYI